MISTTTTTTVTTPSAGSNVAVPFPQRFDEEEHLVLYRVTSAGARTTLTEGVHYSVAGTGNEAGGTITVFTVNAGDTIIASREVDITQQQDYVTNDRFPAAGLEGQLDKQIQIDQQLNNGLGRAIKVLHGEPNPVVSARADREQTFPVWDGNGDYAEYTPGQVWATLPVPPGTVSIHGTKTWADEPARAASVPDFEGQLGVQLDTGGVYRSHGVLAGEWVSAVGVWGTVVFTYAQLAAAAALGAKIAVAANITLEANLTIPGSSTVTVLPGFRIDPDGNTLVFEGRLIATSQVFPSGFDGDIYGYFDGEPVDARWFGVQGYIHNGVTASTDIDHLTSTWTSVAHGMTTGERICWRHWDAGTGAQDLPATDPANKIFVWEVFEVVVVDADRFTMRELNGTPIDLVDAGTGSHRFFREYSRELQAAIDASAVTVTPSTRSPHVKVPKGIITLNEPVYMMSTDGRAVQNVIFEGAGQEKTQFQFLCRYWPENTPCFYMGRNGTLANTFAFSTIIQDFLFYAINGEHCNGFGWTGSPSEGTIMQRIESSYVGKSTIDMRGFNKTYDSSAVAVAAIQFDPDTGVFTSTDHGLYRGRVLYVTGSLPVSAYYVSNVTRHTFTLSTTMALALADTSIGAIDTGFSGQLQVMNPVTYQMEIGHFHSGAPPTGDSHFAYISGAAYRHHIHDLTYNAQFLHNIAVAGRSCTVSGNVMTSLTHGLETGDEIAFGYRDEFYDPYSTTAQGNFGSGSDYPQHIEPNPSGYYFVVVLDADTFSIASSYANAIAGTPILTIKAIIAGNTMHYYLRRFKQAIIGGPGPITTTMIDRANLEDNDIALDFQHALIVTGIGTNETKHAIRLSGIYSSVDMKGFIRTRTFGLNLENYPDIKDEQMDVWRNAYNKPYIRNPASAFSNGTLVVSPGEIMMDSLQAQPPSSAVQPVCWHSITNGIAQLIRAPRYTVNDSVPALYDVYGRVHGTTMRGASTTVHPKIVASQTYGGLSTTGISYSLNESATEFTLPHPEFHREFTMIGLVGRVSETATTATIWKYGYRQDESTAHAILSVIDTLSQTDMSSSPEYLQANYGDSSTTGSMVTSTAPPLSLDTYKPAFVALRFTPTEQALCLNGKWMYDTTTLSEPLLQTKYTVLNYSGDDIVLADASVFEEDDPVYLTSDLTAASVPITLRKKLMYVVGTPGATTIQLAETVGGTPVTPVATTPRAATAATAFAAGGDITSPLHRLVVDQPVVFTTSAGADSLPTEITSGTRYWVKTVPDANTITISATLGGSAITTLTGGAGTATTCTSFAAGGAITSATHGLVMDQPVVFAAGSGSLPAEITAGTTYWVSQVPTPTADVFYVSATRGGAAKTSLTGGASGATVRGYSRLTGYGTQSIHRVPRIYLGGDGSAETAGCVWNEHLFFDHALSDQQVMEWMRFIDSRYQYTPGSESYAPNVQA